ncbi:MAG: hypothetical protein H6713_04250 [Myxococcales bacterium]|nr:hypothetical protein [Myxococcales bacterium]
MASRPYTLLLPFELCERFSLHELLAADPAYNSGEAFRLREEFDVSGPERRFVQTLLRAKTNLWVFRCNQRLFCGDFIVVDMSSASAELRRRVYVLELKAGEPLKRVGGVQLARWPEALAEIASVHGVIAPGVEPELLRGGEREVLEFLGIAQP